MYGQNRRFLLALLSIFQPLGVVIGSGIAYGFIPTYSCGNEGSDSQGKSLLACSKVKPGEACCTKSSNMGWRYTLLCIGAICLAIFFVRFVVFRFQESPKFLLYRGKDEKAVKVLQHIAKFNGRESYITLATFEALDNEEASLASRDTNASILAPKQLKKTWGQTVKFEFVRYKMLFSNSNIARLTILVWITYVFDYWGFSIAGEHTVDKSKQAVTDISQGPSYRKFCSRKIAPSTSHSKQVTGTSSSYTSAVSPVLC